MEEPEIVPGRLYYCLDDGDTRHLIRLKAGAAASRRVRDGITDEALDAAIGATVTREIRGAPRRLFTYKQMEAAVEKLSRLPPKETE